MLCQIRNSTFFSCFSVKCFLLLVLLFNYTVSVLFLTTLIDCHWTLPMELGLKWVFSVALLRGNLWGKWSWICGYEWDRWSLGATGSWQEIFWIMSLVWMYYLSLWGPWDSLGGVPWYFPVQFLDSPIVNNECIELACQAPGKVLKSLNHIGMIEKLFRNPNRHNHVILQTTYQIF